MVKSVKKSVDPDRDPDQHQNWFVVSETSPHLRKFPKNLSISS